ncbi:YqhG family protein [Bacillus sp. FJAT-22090]|uniref:YqhG family protein n=1 Tax=Bacillus sp. FJAT-22090 TaxID=1581038 RepID=UPI0011AAB238|nr:YqhG family protein [Bacillus sp. FJAT-22090]
MYPKQVHEYLLKFFQENNCRILNRNDHYMTVQLTVDIDKKIMNRPFHWQYLESINGVPDPAQLTLITDQNNLNEGIKGEVVHFGSPRLSQMFQVTKELGAFVQMYEKVESVGPRPILTPWLGVNYKVSYYSDQTKEMLHSLGINLMKGSIVNNFHDLLGKVNLVSVSSGDAFHLPYIIKPLRGLERLDLAIENIIQKDDHTWAEEAKQRCLKAQKVLEHFYEEVEDKPECYEMEKTAIDEQYKTRIKIEIINGGLFYLKG